MAKRLRVAVIGVGGMGQGHCKMIQEKVPEMKLVAVCDAMADRVETVAVSLGVKAFTDYKTMYKSGLIDAVVIATPHPIHLEPAIDAMKAGLHVMCEKPLTERISTARKMIAMAKKCKVTFGVMFQRRLEPAVAKALEIVRQGRVGRVYRATLISPEYRSQAYYDSGTWRATWKGEGGGVMMNQSPHVFDIFVQLVGMPVEVRGQIETTSLHQIEVEDRAEATMKFEDGGTGYLYCSTTEPGPGQMIEIFGDRGKLIWRNGTLQFFEYEQSLAGFTKKNKEMWGSVKQTEVPLKIKQFDNGHFLAHRNFAQHILFKKPLLVSGESGLASLELANAITLSSYSDKPVKLPVAAAQYDKLLKRLQDASPAGKKAKKAGSKSSTKKKSSDKAPAASPKKGAVKKAASKKSVVKKTASKKASAKK